MSPDPPTNGSHTHPPPDSVTDLLDIGVAHRTLAGERKSGDAAVVAPFAGGILIGVIDGLGHGAEAAHPAELACTTLQDDPGADVVTLIQRCHAALRRSRGAVMTLVQLHLPGPTMTWIGVGNVEGRVIRGQNPPDGGAHPSEVVLMKGGVVGYRLPALAPATLAINAGDAVMLATDGLRPIELAALSQDAVGAQRQADLLLASHARETDDALVLIARFRGPVTPSDR